MTNLTQPKEARMLIRSEWKSLKRARIMKGFYGAWNAIVNSHFIFWEDLYRMIELERALIERLAPKKSRFVKDGWHLPERPDSWELDKYDIFSSENDIRRVLAYAQELGFLGFSENGLSEAVVPPDIAQRDYRALSKLCNEEEMYEAGGIFYHERDW